MANNYFPEEKVKELILKYQEITKFDENGKKIIYDEALETEIVKYLLTIVKCIINVYKYYIFEDYEDLVQFGIMNCFSSLMKYDPKYGTVFNYFSIVCKLSLYNYTMRRKKHRNHLNIDEQVGLETEKEVNWDIYFNNLEAELNNTVNENFIGNKRNDYLKINFLVIKYFRSNIKQQGKSDLLKYLRSYGIKSSTFKQYSNDVGNVADVMKDFSTCVEKI